MPVFGGVANTKRPVSSIGIELDIGLHEIGCLWEVTGSWKPISRYFHSQMSCSSSFVVVMG